MQEIIDAIRQSINPDLVRLLIRALAALLIGGAVTLIVPKRLKFTLLEPQRVFLIQQVARYGLATLTVAMVLRELGLNLDVFLGAAGVLTVAVGFASQTTASNLISGLFLMGEHPFGVGDWRGVVLRIVRFSGLSAAVHTITGRRRERVHRGHGHEHIVHQTSLSQRLIGLPLRYGLERLPHLGAPQVLGFVALLK